MVPVYRPRSQLFFYRPVVLRDLVQAGAAYFRLVLWVQANGPRRNTGGEMSLGRSAIVTPRGESVFRDFPAWRDARACRRPSPHSQCPTCATPRILRQALPAGAQLALGARAVGDVQHREDQPRLEVARLQHGRLQQGIEQELPSRRRQTVSAPPTPLPHLRVLDAPNPQVLLLARIELWVGIPVSWATGYPGHLRKTLVRPHQAPVRVDTADAQRRHLEDARGDWPRLVKRWANISRTFDPGTWPAGASRRHGRTPPPARAPRRWCPNDERIHSRNVFACLRTGRNKNKSK